MTIDIKNKNKLSCKLDDSLTFKGGNFMPKVTQSIKETTVNTEGEIIQESQKLTYSWGNEPPFVKLYLQDILYLSELPNHHEKILFELLKRASYSGEKYGMHVTLSAGLKRMMASDLEIKNIRTINNALSDLVKGKILIHMETGVYQFNPYFFGKGDWQDIAKMRLEINYDSIKGKTFKAVCEFHDELKKETETILKNGTEG